MSNFKTFKQKNYAYVRFRNDVPSSITELPILRLWTESVKTSFQQDHRCQIRTTKTSRFCSREIESWPVGWLNQGCFEELLVGKTFCQDYFCWYTLKNMIQKSTSHLPSPLALDRQMTSSLAFWWEWQFHHLWLGVNGGNTFPAILFFHHPSSQERAWGK